MLRKAYFLQQKTRSKNEKKRRNLYDKTHKTAKSDENEGGRGAKKQGASTVKNKVLRFLNDFI